ncbi:hypothetical protein GOBAR_AA22662 [Gossypium barbadense]|uniref:Uncharacterized protein n=1 Tax=Gossypium barbadense TaxID=3634 RepID=A0A2P5X3T3_GOSBA|nr:hypothetical protein GOBAR_AA22662 [Gossypium barbadense]
MRERKKSRCNGSSDEEDDKRAIRNRKRLGERIHDDDNNKSRRRAIVDGNSEPSDQSEEDKRANRDKRGGRIEVIGTTLDIGIGVMIDGWSLKMIDIEIGIDGVVHGMIQMMIRRRITEGVMIDDRNLEMIVINAVIHGMFRMMVMRITEKGRSGGIYIPPFKLARMMEETQDKSSVKCQRLTWDALRKSINGLVNKVNATNIKNIAPELFAENLTRERGSFTERHAKRLKYISSPCPIVKRVYLSIFRGYPAVRLELDLVEEDEQLTHEISLQDEIDPEITIDILKPDPQYLENEK